MLFVAFGFLKWFEAEHSDEPRLSPLLLVPVYLGRIGAAVPWKLALYEDEITPNFCLRKLMKRDFRLELPEVDPLALLDDEQARERYETAVRDALRNESGWEVMSDGKIPWPIGKLRQGRSLIVFGGLADVIRRESN